MSTIFHRFNLSDCEDPDLYAAEAILIWEKTPMGEWVKKHCPDTSYRISANPYIWGFEVVIYGNLSSNDATYFTLKYK